MSRAVTLVLRQCMSQALAIPEAVPTTQGTHCSLHTIDLYCELHCCELQCCYIVCVIYHMHHLLLNIKTASKATATVIKHGD